MEGILVDNNFDELLSYGYYGNLRGEWLRKNQPAIFNALSQNGELESYLLSYQKSYSLKSYRLFQKFEEEYGITESLHSNDFPAFIRLQYKISQKVNEILKNEIEQ